MTTDALEGLGLARNEGFIYITLVKFGGMGISKIADKSGVHRRNVYDSMRRLLERGLVYEEVGHTENTYFAVDPQKLLEIAEEKRQKIEKLLPELQQSFGKTVSSEAVYIYRGLEGYKNYLRDMVRIKQEVCILGATGASLDPQLQVFFNQIKASLERNKIPVKVLYLASAYQADKQILGHFGKTSFSKVLPKTMELPSSWAVFGDHVYLVTGGYHFKAVENELTMTVIKNKINADGFRMQFDHFWSMSNKSK